MCPWLPLARRCPGDGKLASHCHRRRFGAIWARAGQPEGTSRRKGTGEAGPRRGLGPTLHPSAVTEARPTQPCPGLVPSPEQSPLLVVPGVRIPVQKLTDSGHSCGEGRSSPLPRLWGSRTPQGPPESREGLCGSRRLCQVGQPPLPHLYQASGRSPRTVWAGVNWLKLWT